ncbi:6004_t:CDS:2, partial [Funneliformis caledonium]
MSKVDTYFDDLTSCSLFGFLEHKRPTEKRKAYSVYKGTLIYIAKDDTTKPERRTLAQACLNVFELSVRPLCQWGNCLSAGVDFTLPPNLCVVELRPPCREQTNSVPVEQYWMDLAKYKLENEIYLEEICRLLRKTITKRFEKRSVSEVEEKVKPVNTQSLTSSLVTTSRITELYE